MNTQTQMLANNVANATRRLYRGSSVMHFILSSKDSNGALSVIDVHMYKGTEPPRHVHDREDETFIITEGSITFFIGDNMIRATAGDVVFAPRAVAHHFIADTEMVKFRLLLTPGNFDQFFWEQSVPYSAGEPVRPLTSPSPEAIQSIIKYAAGFGTRFI